ncbi:DoxX-like family protein [Sphingobacterium sp. HJSM2_6]|uniref:DoxX-like family protein n=1 Tax=Sphingobacterium sp. HJSM2_6 TaxID=3366264 RepID=UPI003BD3E34C
MNANRIYNVLNYCFALIWIINGLFCKILNLVPRHEQIIAKILNEDYSRPLTILIGFSEILMAFWILSGIMRKLNAVVQIAVIAFMNILEFILVPDLLLWGRMNMVFAFLLISVIYYNEFYLRKNLYY